MKGILKLLGMSALGSLGWAVGMQVSVFLAFIASVLGCGVGLYLIQRAIDRYLP